jgi:hypothetical protein
MALANTPAYYNMATIAAVKGIQYRPQCWYAQITNAFFTIIKLIEV